MVIDNVSFGWTLFMKIVLIKSSSSISLVFEQIIKAQWTKILIRLIFRFLGQNESQRVSRPVNVGFLYTEMKKKKKNGITTFGQNVKKCKRTGGFKFTSQFQDSM